MAGADTTTLIRGLRGRDGSERVTNFYRRRHLAANLERYFEAVFARRGPRVLLVGEAPGFCGARHTGIPFSSGLLYERIEHPFLQALRQRLTLREHLSENTASIVWRYLADTDIVPLFWNAFPFHPHPPHDDHKNRRPTRAEMNEGGFYLDALEKLYRPDIIAGIGAVGTEAARRAFPEREIAGIRHPSYGGKSEFFKGMDALLEAVKLPDL